MARGSSCKTSCSPTRRGSWRISETKRLKNVHTWRKADELTGACRIKTVRKWLMATNTRSQRKPSNLRKHGLEAPIKAEGFNHLHINVRDLARSIRYYAEAFG